MRNNRALIPLLALSLVAAACTGTAGAPASSSGGTASSGPIGRTQTNEGGQVTVVATWSGPAAAATFDIKLDTHSVDLDALDFSNAVLSNDRGQTLAALPWTAANGGHHREGTLRFNGDATAFFAGAAWIELTLVGVGDIAVRTLRWEIGT